MPIPTNSPNGEQPVTSNDEPRDADEYEVDYLTTRDGLSDVTDALQRRNERLHDDVSKRNNAIQAERNENSNGRTRPSTTKIMKNLCRFRPKAGKLIQTLQKNSSDENDAQDSPNIGDDIIVTEISQNDGRNEKLSPRGEKYNLRPILIETTQKTSDTRN